MSVRDTAARVAVSGVLERLRTGRIEVVEDGRTRAFGPAGAELRAVTVHDPAAWRGPRSSHSIVARRRYVSRSPPPETRR